MSTAIFIPTFKRAYKLQSVVDNIKANTTGDYKIYFIVEESDQESWEAIRRTGESFIVNLGKPCYADCINTAYHRTTEDVFLTGADDLKFYPNWLENGLKAFTHGIMVVGTNDFYPANTAERHGTHYLVKREYIEKQSGCIDTPNIVLYPYSHNYTDREFIETARKRGVYAYAEDCKVEHLHWSFRKSYMDDTYRKGFVTSKQDEALFNERKKLWK